MHELSIAGAIVEIALDHARGRRVSRVGLRVGHLRQVVPDALAFAFELVARGTGAEGAVLEIEEVAVAVACRACGAESPAAAFPLRCHGCGSLEVAVARGEELSVEWLDLDDALAGGADHSEEGRQTR